MDVVIGCGYLRNNRLMLVESSAIRGFARPWPMHEWKGYAVEFWYADKRPPREYQSVLCETMLNE